MNNPERRTMMILLALLLVMILLLAYFRNAEARETLTPMRWKSTIPASRWRIYPPLPKRTASCRAFTG